MVLTLRVVVLMLRVMVLTLGVVVLMLRVMP